MDYYAAHRMTDDSHVRIYADGSKEDLHVLCSWYKLSDDPEEAKRLKEEHDHRNREVLRTLAEKGFDKFTINMYLSARMHEEKEEHLPDKFEITRTFMGLGSNKLYLKGDLLIFESKRNSRYLELTPLKEEWLQFWSRMDQISVLGLERKI